MLLLVLGCQPIAEVAFDSHSWVEETAAPVYFAEELVTPVGFMVWDEGFLIADSGLEALVYVDELGVSIFAEDIVDPVELVYGAESYLSTTQEIYAIDESGDLLLIADERESPSSLLIFEDTLYWLEGQSLFRSHDGGVEELLSELPDPYEIVVWKGDLWFTTQQDKAIWRFDFESEPIQMYTMSEIPHCIIAGDEQLWVSTRSFRWPYGGWIASFDASELEKQTQSPPEAEHLVAYQDGIVWSSKQTITYWSEDPYLSIAQQVMVSELHIVEDELIWSDAQGGRMGRVKMSSFMDN